MKNQPVRTWEESPWSNHMTQRGKIASQMLTLSLSLSQCHFFTSNGKGHYSHQVENTDPTLSFHITVATSFVDELTQSPTTFYNINPGESATLTTLSQTHALSLSIWPSMAASEGQNNGTSIRNAFGNVLAFFILLLIGVLAFSIRLFSVSISLFLLSSFSDPFTFISFFNAISSVGIQQLR